MLPPSFQWHKLSTLPLKLLASASLTTLPKSWKQVRCKSERDIEVAYGIETWNSQSTPYAVSLEHIWWKLLYFHTIGWCQHKWILGQSCFDILRCSRQNPWDLMPSDASVVLRVSGRVWQQTKELNWGCKHLSPPSHLLQPPLQTPKCKSWQGNPETWWHLRSPRTKALGWSSQKDSQCDMQPIQRRTWRTFIGKIYI